MTKLKGVFTRKRGISLIMAIVVSAVFLGMIAILFSFSYLLQAQTRRQVSISQAISLGNGGINHALAKYRVDAAYGGEIYETDTGELNLSVTDFGTNKLITSRSYVPRKNALSRVCKTFQAIIDSSTKNIIKKTYVEINEADCGDAIAQPESESLCDDYTAYSDAGSVLPTAITGAGAAFKNTTSGVSNPDTNMVYIFGGFGNGGLSDYKNTIYSFNPVNNQISLLTVTLPNNRAGVSAVYSTVNDRIYLFGGYNETTTFNDILEFDPVGQTLITKTATLPTARSQTAAVWNDTNDRVYIFGGHNGNYGIRDIIEYDPASDTIVNKSAGVGAVSLPDAVYNVSAVWGDTTNKIYIIGGEDSGRYSYINIYDPAANTVTSHTTVLPSARSQTAAVWSTLNDRVYIFGGIDASGTSLTQTLEFNPAASAANPTTMATVFSSGRRKAAVVWDSWRNRAFIFGGEGSPAKDEVGAYGDCDGGGIQIWPSPSAQPSPSPTPTATVTPSSTPSPSPSASPSSPPSVSDKITFALSLGTRNDDVTFAGTQARLYIYDQINNGGRVITSTSSGSAEQSAPGEPWVFTFSNPSSGTYCVEFEFNFRSGSSSYINYPGLKYQAKSNSEIFNGVTGPFLYTNGVKATTGNAFNEVIAGNAGSAECPSSVGS